MACNLRCFSHRLRTSFSSSNSPISCPMLPRRRLRFSIPTVSFNSARQCSSAASSASGFTWDDVFTIARSENDSSSLHGFFDKIKICNRGSEKQHEFMSFVIEDRIVGYVHSGFADYLRRFQDVFVFLTTNSYSNRFDEHVSLHPNLRTPEDRTKAVADVVKCLGEELIPAIPCHLILWLISLFLTGACSSSLFRNKGLWCSHEWLC